jgi:hypothetical protein
MDNTQIITVKDEYTNQDIDWVIIDRGNGEFTSMLKSTYDEMIAAQSTPIDTEDE